jgi:predicted O-methyltransferase YrrM
MNAERRAIAAEILEVSRTHDAAQKDRLARFRNVEPETAELLGILIRATRAERILELGTSNGYSTLWLADGAEATGGAVLSVDVDGDRTNMAAENLDRAGLLAVLRTADAAAVLATAKDESWDLIFLDSERPAYVSYWPDLLRTMRSPGGVLVIDNVISHAEEVAEVTGLIEREPSVVSSVVSIGAGVRLVVRD